MRYPRLLLPTLLALASAACSSQKPAYYVTDSVTGQRVATGPQSAARGERGIFTSDSSRAGGAYAFATTQTPENTGGRGLFNSDIFSSRSPVYVYPAQPQPPQTYSYRPPQTDARQSATMQYRPPQPQYPRPQPSGYYAERYRWY